MSEKRNSVIAVVGIDIGKSALHDRRPRWAWRDRAAADDLFKASSRDSTPVTAVEGRYLSRPRRRRSPPSSRRGAVFGHYADMALQAVWEATKQDPASVLIWRGNYWLRGRI